MDARPRMFAVGGSAITDNSCCTVSRAATGGARDSRPATQPSLHDSASAQSARLSPVRMARATAGDACDPRLATQPARVTPARLHHRRQRPHDARHHRPARAPVAGAGDCGRRRSAAVSTARPLLHPGHGRRRTNAIRRSPSAAGPHLRGPGTACATERGAPPRPLRAYSAARPWAGIATAAWSPC